MLIFPFPCRPYFKSKDLYHKSGWCLFLCLLVIFSCKVALASEKRPEPKETLVGITELFVSAKIGLAEGGPTQMKLQDLVEKKIANAGLVVHLEIENEEESIIPSLHIDVAVAKGKNNFHTFFVTLRYYQIVKLQQGGEIISPSAATWEVATLGVGDFASIQEKVEDLTEIFLRDYRAVN